MPRADPSCSAAVLIGVGRYRTDFPDVPQADGCVRRVAEQFAMPEVWGLRRPSRLLELTDPDRATVLQTVGDAANLVKPGGLLVIYFVGHAETSEHDLCLATTDGDRSRPRTSMVTVANLVDEVERHGRRDTPTVLILDCCFAGHADRSVPVKAVSAKQAAGFYLIGAAHARSTADSGSGRELTVFTESFLTAVHGTPDQPATLSAADVFARVATLLPEHPPVHNNGTAGTAPWLANRAYRQPTLAPVAINVPETLDRYPRAEVTTILSGPAGTERSRQLGRTEIDDAGEAEPAEGKESRRRGAGAHRKELVLAVMVLASAVAAVVSVFAGQIRGLGQPSGPAEAQPITASPAPRPMTSPTGTEKSPPPFVPTTRDAAATPTSTTRKPSPTPPSPTPPLPPREDRSPTTGAATGEIEILGNRLVDFDMQEPDVTAYNPQSDIGDTIDLRVGPDNLYPLNGAENWFKQSGTCESEHASHGLKGELALKTELAGTPGKAIAVCLYTTGGSYLTLSISTEQADGGGDPYRFAMTSG